MADFYCSFNPVVTERHNSPKKRFEMSFSLQIGISLSETFPLEKLQKLLLEANAEFEAMKKKEPLKALERAADCLPLCDIRFKI